MPSIEFDSDNKILYESLVIADYLDEAYPSKLKLSADDPFQKAIDRLFVESLSSYSSAYAKVFYSKDDINSIWIEVHDALKKLEEKLANRKKGKFLSGLHCLDLHFVCYSIRIEN